MKLFLLTGALLILGSGALRAQEPLPRPETPDTAEPKAQPAATPLPVPELIPADVLPVPPKSAPNAGLPGIPQLDEGFKPAPLSPLANQQRQHLEWRRLRNAVENDPTVKAALQAADAARTDLEKRKLLGRYYDLLYGKMLSRAAPEMKGYLAARKKEALQALPQPRVRPGVQVSKSDSRSSSPPPGEPVASPSPSEPPVRIPTPLDPVP